VELTGGGGKNALTQRGAASGVVRGTDVREAVFEVAVRERWRSGMAQETMTLDEVFRQLTAGVPS